jgi:hypothetical protein
MSELDEVEEEEGEKEEEVDVSGNAAVISGGRK